MSTSTTQPLANLFHVIFKTTDASPKHWAFAAQVDGEDSAKATRIHAEGGLDNNFNPFFYFQVENSKYIQSNATEQVKDIPLLRPISLPEFLELARAIPMPSSQASPPSNCQSWLIWVLEDLQKKGYISQENVERIKALKECMYLLILK